MKNSHGRPTDIPLGQAKLYILLDGALMDALRYAYSSDTSPETEALYRDTRHDAALQISPLLIKPSPESDFLSQQHLWRKNGIVLRSEASIAVLSQHLKSLISVRLPSQQMAYCRFYSPEWLVRFLTSLSDDELSAWSGPIQEWYAYSSQTWVGFQPSANKGGRKAVDEGWFCLRREQIVQWQADEHQRFLRKAAALLGRDVLSGSQEADALSDIAESVNAAHSHGFILEYQCLHYLELTHKFPQAFNSPEFTKVIRDLSQSADSRLQQAELLLFGLQEA